MKTNIVLKSSSRDLFGITIRQETKTGFLNLSDLQESFTRKRISEGWDEKRIDHILNYKDNHERIYYLLKEQGVIIPTVTGFIEEVDSQGIAKTLKKYGFYKTTGARNTKTTWCNPYIFTLIALELHPEFYAKVVVWITDQLIINRIEAGNFYKELSASISRFKDVDYIKIAKALNYIAFGRHEAGIRNSGTKEQLNELYELEKQMSFAINMGYVKTQDQLVDDLRVIYKNKFK